MRIIGITKIKNESKILQDTLDHWGSICTGGIYVYDDCSIDHSAIICAHHKSVKKVIHGADWDKDT